jgi:signal peptidase I
MEKFKAAFAFLRNPIWLEFLITAALAVAFYLGVHFSLQNAEVFGPSMQPNLYQGERVLLNKLAYKFGEPQRGDIIVFDPPEEVGAENDYVKRIIGLPGETVEVTGGHVYIHTTGGQVIQLDESAYLSESTPGAVTSGVIPEGHYFVMGDNRDESADSRQGWLVAESDIVGRAWLIVWPLSDWGSALNYHYDF